MEDHDPDEPPFDFRDDLRMLWSREQPLRGDRELLAREVANRRTDSMPLLVKYVQDASESGV
jgi:hypothetical protein